MVGKRKIPGNPQRVPRDMLVVFHPLWKNRPGTVRAVGRTAFPRAKARARPKAGRCPV